MKPARSGADDMGNGVCHDQARSYVGFRGHVGCRLCRARVGDGGPGNRRKIAHAIAVSAFGSALLPGKVTLLNTDARRVLLSVSLVKILPVLLERTREPESWLSAVSNKFRDNRLFKEVAPYLWFVVALLILTLLSGRELRHAAIPAPRSRKRSALGQASPGLIAYGGSIRLRAAAWPPFVCRNS